MGFRTKLVAREAGPGEWQLEMPLVYETRSGDYIIADIGFITDLASVPQFLQGFFSINDETRAPAVIHDWLYITQPMPRWLADEIFLDAMHDAGVAWWKRRLFYAAVHAFGQVVWDSSSRRKEARMKNVR